ncbi:unnamed protein product [Adineta ricciae]|uniref:Beta-sarcoglycan n=2 Tax=Adineta ricciae TaxID=249248 RepID=A0A813QDY0_ADIRI|nr:unnamed protein product [Adineta ricciae]
MGRNRYNHRRNSSVMLDAGYVSIQAIDFYGSTQIFGLHGRKLFCVIVLVFLLFIISFINLTCLVFIMYKLDWTPLHKNGSKVFRFDKFDHQIELYKSTTFRDIIYTTQIKDDSSLDVLSRTPIDIYGDHNSLLLNENQISMNAEYFSLNHKYLVDFTNLNLYKFDRKRKTNVHLSQVESHYIHDKQLNLTGDKLLTITKANRVSLNARNINVDLNKHHHRSVVRLGSYWKRRKPTDYRQKIAHGNLQFQTNSIFLDLPRSSPGESTSYSEINVYRMCICNTTLLLLQSFAHQPCPLC